MRLSCCGATSQSVKALGSSPREVICLEVWMVPRSCSKWAASACVMLCAPRSGMGQPTACTVTASTMPIAALRGASRLRKECAASPAKTARVRGLLN